MDAPPSNLSSRPARIRISCWAWWNRWALYGFPIQFRHPRALQSRGIPEER